MRKERYTSIEVYNQIVSEEDESSLDYFYFPKYLPLGFTVTEEYSADHSYYVRFANGSEYFCLSQWEQIVGKESHIDTEDLKIEAVDINGHEGFYAEIEDKRFIYLDTGNISINIYGNIEKNEIFQMARHLELLKKQF